MNAILLKFMALRSELEVSEGRQEPYSKRLPIPLSCLTKAVLSSSNFPPRKSVFRVRLTGNKTKHEMKTGILVCFFLITKINLNTSMGGLFLNFELALNFFRQK